MGKIIKNRTEYFFGGGGSVDVLDTMSEINSNTEEDKVAGALAVKELNDTVTGLDNIKAPRENPTFTFAGMGAESNVNVEFRKSGDTGSFGIALVAVDANGNKTYNTLIDGASGSPVRNWVTPSELNTLKTSFQAGYSTIADAITEKGITIADNASPEEIAEIIRDIQSGVCINAGTIKFKLNSSTTLDIKNVLAQNHIAVGDITADNIYLRPKGTVDSTSKAGSVATISKDFKISYSNGVVTATTGDVAYLSAFGIEFDVYVVMISEAELQPLKSNLIGTAASTSVTTFDLSSYDGYEAFTSNSFLVMPSSAGARVANGNWGGSTGVSVNADYTFNLSYEAPTLSVTSYATGAAGGGYGTLKGNVAVPVDVYLVTEGISSGSGNSSAGGSVKVTSYEKIVNKEGLTSSNVVSEESTYQDGTLTYDLTSIPNYQNLILHENLFVEVNETHSATDNYFWSNTYAYNASTGTLSISYRRCIPLSINAYVLENAKITDGDSGNGTQVIDLGSGTSFDVSSYEGYENFTVDNFIVEPIAGNKSTWYDKGDNDCKGYLNPNVYVTKSYNNGILTAQVSGGMYVTGDDGGTLSVSDFYDAEVKAYLIIDNNTSSGGSEISTVPQKKMYYLGQANFSGTLLTTSRIFSFDYSHIPNYENLTVEDFYLGMGDYRIYMTTKSAEGRLAFEINTPGTLRLKWFGTAQQDNCNVNCYVYCLGDSEDSVAINKSTSDFLYITGSQVSGTKTFNNLPTKGYMTQIDSTTYGVATVTYNNIELTAVTSKLAQQENVRLMRTNLYSYKIIDTSLPVTVEYTTGRSEEFYMVMFAKEMI